MSDGTENNDSFNVSYGNGSYRLDVDGGIIKDMDVNIVTFINLTKLGTPVTDNSYNNVFTQDGLVEAIISKITDVELPEEDRKGYRHYQIQPTSTQQVPYINYLMEYDIYEDDYMNDAVGRECKDLGGLKNAPYIGELLSYSKDGTFTDKVLKVIFPVNLVGEYDIALIGKYDSGGGVLTYSYSIVVLVNNELPKVSGIASVIYTPNPNFPGVTDLMHNIHLSNYSKPHIFQNNSLSTAANYGKLLDTKVRINERNFINTVPYKNIIMHKDYSIQYIGNYLYGGIDNRAGGS